MKLNELLKTNTGIIGPVGKFDGICGGARNTNPFWFGRCQPGVSSFPGVEDITTLAYPGIVGLATVGLAKMAKTASSLIMLSLLLLINWSLNEFCMKNIKIITIPITVIFS